MDQYPCLKKMMKIKKYLILFLALAMIFAMSACKKSEDSPETEIPVDDPQQETVEDVTIAEVDPEPSDSTVDMEDFTIESLGFEFTKQEKLEDIAAYYYSSPEGNMCITQEDFEWTDENFEEWTSMGGKEVTYGGITGYETNMFDDSYSFSFNKNGRAWQITCDTEELYHSVIDTIKAK